MARLHKKPPLCQKKPSYFLKYPLFFECVPSAYQSSSVFRKALLIKDPHFDKEGRLFSNTEL
jgi:hypothetical protein